MGLVCELRTDQQKYLCCFASIRDVLARDGVFSDWNEVSEKHCLDKDLLASWDLRSDLLDRSSAANNY